MTRPRGVKTAPARRPVGPKAKGARPVRDDLVRAAVLEAYGSIRLEGRLADRVLESLLRRERRMYANERRAVAETVYALIRRQLLIDRGLTDALGARFGRLPPATADSLRLASLRVLEGGNPDAVRRAFGLPADMEGALSSMKRFESGLGALPVRERISLGCSLPPWIVDRFIAEVGETEAEALAKALNERAPLTVRANTLRIDRSGLKARLAGEEMPSHETPYSELGLFLDARQNAFGLNAFREGLFEVQDEGSQLLAKLVGARPGELVVDACAGAGGKTLALAASMENRGRLLAMDTSAERLDEMRKRARRAGVGNVEARTLAAGTAADAQIRDLTRKADRVLIDAPCSGLGALRRNPDTRYRLTPEQVTEHAARQAELIERFSGLVKPGGVVVYATCSVLRAENEDVTDRFLERHPEFDRVDPAELLGQNLAAALGCVQALRLWPQRHRTDGFYGVVLRRKNATGS